jgi:hypothetical protein
MLERSEIMSRDRIYLHIKCRVTRATRLSSVICQSISDQTVEFPHGKIAHFVENRDARDGRVPNGEKMYELSKVEVEQVSGGRITAAQFAEGCALVGLGCLALAAAPFAVGVGVAAAVGMGTAGGVAAAGGAWLMSTGW